MTAVTIRALVFVIACLPCAGLEAAGSSLYDRLGGGDGVGAIANSLIDRVAADPKIGRSFKGTQLGRIKRLLAEQICDLSGGPCHYSGDTMQQVHAGHHITEADFFGMITALRAVLKERGVSLGATNELLRLLAPMKRDIVETERPAAR